MSDGAFGPWSNELFDSVFQFLTISELASFRLTCKRHAELVLTYVRRNRTVIDFARLPVLQRGSVDACERLISALNQVETQLCLLDKVTLVTGSRGSGHILRTPPTTSAVQCSAVQNSDQRRA